MKTREASFQIGFQDGQLCADDMLKMYNIDDLLEMLRNPYLEYEDIYYKGNIKSQEVLEKAGIDPDAYKEGFYAGCRDIITVGHEEKELGVGD